MHNHWLDLYKQRTSEGTLCLDSSLSRSDGLAAGKHHSLSLSGPVVSSCGFEAVVQLNNHQHIGLVFNLTVWIWCLYLR